MDTATRMPTLRLLRVALIVLTLVTAVNHLFIGSNTLTEPDRSLLAILFVLNGIGFLVLLASILTRFVPILSNHKRPAHYAMMAYTIATIAAYVLVSGILSGEPPMPIAVMTKVDEGLLVAVTYLHLRVL
jgi:hypothetical protein